MNEPSPTADVFLLDDVIVPGTLPALRIRELPPSVPLRQMIGPSIILAGLALGSGEYVIWPFITFKSGFVFFWACLLAVVTQYFLNMEIMRWTLATGETAITGFVRVSRHFAWIFLILNIVPWIIPAWAKGTAQLAGWLIWGPNLDSGGSVVAGSYDNYLAIVGLLLAGVILTSGPVIYETVERVQFFLVVLIMVIVLALAAWLIWLRPDAVVTQATAIVTLGAPDFLPPIDSRHLTPMMLLGALAFAGAGGTMNLSQSNYIRDKGYGMGKHVGRMTNPLTGNEEAVSEVGYHFPHDAANAERWRAWWRSAGWEHFFSFLMTCIVCLVLLTLISFTLYYDAAGNLTVNPEHYKEGLGFVWGEALRLQAVIGPVAKYGFLVMGMAILFTTEFGVLDAASRISTDIVKVTWLRENARWTEGRLYFCFLWGEIALATVILLLDVWQIHIDALGLFQLTAAMNGGVMFLYAMILFYVNRFRLPALVRIPLWRLAILGWTILFYGTFTIWAGYDALSRMFS